MSESSVVIKMRLGKGPWVLYKSHAMALAAARDFISLPDRVQIQECHKINDVIYTFCSTEDFSAIEQAIRSLETWRVVPTEDHIQPMGVAEDAIEDQIDEDLKRYDAYVEEHGHPPCCPPETVKGNDDDDDVAFGEACAEELASAAPVEPISQETRIGDVVEFNGKPSRFRGLRGRVPGSPETRLIDMLEEQDKLLVKERATYGQGRERLWVLIRNGQRKIKDLLSQVAKQAEYADKLKKQNDRDDVRIGDLYKTNEELLERNASLIAYWQDKYQAASGAADDSRAAVLELEAAAATAADGREAFEAKALDAARASVADQCHRLQDRLSITKQDNRNLFEQNEKLKVENARLAGERDAWEAITESRRIEGEAAILALEHMTDGRNDARELAALRLETMDNLQTRIDEALEMIRQRPPTNMLLRRVVSTLKGETAS